MRSRLALCVVMISAMAAAAARIGASPTPGAPAEVPTWSKDVAPIVQKNCQECHRPGEIGPFSLLTYQDARRRATKIKDAVADKVMPPWFADPHHGKFSNAMGLSPSAIDTIVKWVDGGAPEGDPRDLPKPARVGRRLGHRQAGHGVRAAAALRSSGDRRHRVSARHRPDELQRRPLDSWRRKCVPPSDRSCIT